jgi:hypothetical protein
MGNLSTIKFNYWNVMEYSIGFFGGVGMTYGTLTSSWEIAEDRQKKSSVWFPLLMLTLIIPFVVWDQTFTVKKLEETYVKIATGDIPALTSTVQWIALAVVLMSSVIWFVKYYRNKASEFVSYNYSDVRTFFVGHLGLYTAFSFLITGAFMSGYRPEQYLYLVNLAIVTLLIGKTKPGFSNRGLYAGRWAVGFALVLVFIALITLVAINMHGELKGMNRRFE